MKATMILIINEDDYLAGKQYKVILKKVFHFPEGRHIIKLFKN